MQKWLLIASNIGVPDRVELTKLLDRLDAKVLKDLNYFVLIECPVGKAETMPEYCKSKAAKTTAWMIQP